MGNCLRKKSSMEWGGEDWGSLRMGSDDKTRLTGGSAAEEGKSVLSCSLAAEGTEVKIKISKKELEKLLKESEVDGLSAQQVVAQLMNVSDEFEANERPWRPALQSIPE